MPWCVSSGNNYSIKDISVRGDSTEAVWSALRGLIFSLNPTLSNERICSGACPHAPFTALKKFRCVKTAPRRFATCFLSHKSHFSYCGNCFPNTAIVSPFLRLIFAPGAIKSLVQLVKLQHRDCLTGLTWWNLCQDLFKDTFRALWENFIQQQPRC